jgi:hypothetical protein
MKRTLTLLVLGLLSALGVGGAVRSVSATQSQRPVATIAPVFSVFCHSAKQRSSRRTGR